MKLLMVFVVGIPLATLVCTAIYWYGRLWEWIIWREKYHELTFIFGALCMFFTAAFLFIAALLGSLVIERSAEPRPGRVGSVREMGTSGRVELNGFPPLSF